MAAQVGSITIDNSETPLSSPGLKVSPSGLKGEFTSLMMAPSQFTVANLNGRQTLQLVLLLLGEDDADDIEQALDYYAEDLAYRIDNHPDDFSGDERSARGHVRRMRALHKRLFAAERANRTR